MNFYQNQACRKWMDQKTHLPIRPLLQLTSEYQQESHWSLTNAVVHNELCKGKRWCNFHCISSILDIEVSIIVENWEYQLKKSWSTVIRHLYGRVNQNKMNQICKIKSKVKKNNKIKQKHTRNITYLHPFIEFTSSSNCRL